MKYEDTIKKHLVGLIMLLALAVGITMIASLFIGRGNSGKNQESQDNPDSIKSVNIPMDHLPNKFPAELPIEVGATIIQNFNATAEDGTYQATRGFETKKSLAENMTLYTSFLTKNGWKLGTVVDQATYKMIPASKGPGRLQISMNDGPEENKKTVVINFTELP